MQRREFLKKSSAAVASATLATTVQALPKTSQSRPNLLFITVDDNGLGLGVIHAILK